jgi:hypothetical protein
VADKKKQTKAPIKIQRSVNVSERVVDMLESAISQLALREPEWRPSALNFARECGFDRTVSVLEHLRDTAKARQMTLVDISVTEAPTQHIDNG